MDWRLSGRAPSSGLNPFSIMNAYADSSTSTAHGRPRSPRRAIASASSLSSSARICVRSNGRKTTIRSIRFRNSGRNSSRTPPSIPASETCVRWTKPRRLPVRARAEVRGEDDDGATEVDRRPCGQSTGRRRRPAGRGPRPAAAAFSNSSRSTTANGSLRTDEISADRVPPPVVSERSRSSASGVWYSLMSSRISRRRNRTGTRRAPSRFPSSRCRSGRRRGTHRAGAWGRSLPP